MVMDGLVILGFVMDGFVMLGLVMDGLVIEGLYTSALVIEGFVMDGFVMLGLVIDGLVMLGLSSIVPRSGLAASVTSTVIAKLGSDEVTNTARAAPDRAGMGTRIEVTAAAANWSNEAFPPAGCGLVMANWNVRS